MKCRLVIGSNFYDLAGADGVASETQGLSVNYDVTSEQVAYIGATEARQFWRPGSSVRATFSSQVTFSSVADAEAEIGLLYGFLKNQEGAVAYLGDIADDGSVQIETATAAGTITGDGDAEVIVTAAAVEGSPKTLSVAVLNGDTASDWAGKVRTALDADADITRVYTVSGTSDEIVLTSKVKMADATLNISLDNDTCTGITPAPTSTNTQAGAYQTVTPILTIYDAITQVGVAYRGRTLSISSSIIGRTENPSP